MCLFGGGGLEASSKKTSLQRRKVLVRAMRATLAAFVFMMSLIQPCVAWQAPAITLLGLVATHVTYLFIHPIHEVAEPEATTLREALATRPFITESYVCVGDEHTGFETWADWERRRLQVVDVVDADDAVDAADAVDAEPFESHFQWFKAVLVKACFSVLGVVVISLEIMRKQREADQAMKNLRDEEAHVAELLEIVRQSGMQDVIASIEEELKLPDKELSQLQAVRQRCQGKGNLKFWQLALIVFVGTIVGLLTGSCWAAAAISAIVRYIV